MKKTTKKVSRKSVKTTRASKGLRREAHIKRYKMSVGVNWVVFVLGLVMIMSLFMSVMFLGEVGYNIVHTPILLINAFIVISALHFSVGGLIYATMIGFLMANALTVMRAKRNITTVFIATLDLAFLVYVTIVPVKIFDICFVVALVIVLAIFVKVLGEKTIPKGGFKRGEIEGGNEKTKVARKNIRRAKNDGDEDEI